MAAESQMEAAQRALRKPEYDSESDDDEMSAELNALNPLSDSSSSVRQRGSSSVAAVQTSQGGNSTFDPYAPLPSQPTPEAKAQSQEALFDATAFELSSMIAEDELKTSSSQIPGAAGYLEIEEEPPRVSGDRQDEGITTNSGLLLTHRKSPPPVKNRKPSNKHSNRQRNFEVEYGTSKRGPPPPAYSYRNQATAMVQAKRLLSYVRLWMVVCFAALLFTTAVFLHSFKHHPQTEVSKNNLNNNNYNMNNNNNYYNNNNNMGGATTEYNVYSGNQQYENNFQTKEQILLVPMEDISQLHRQKQNDPPRRQLSLTHGHNQNVKNHHHGIEGTVEYLRQEFEAWIEEHGKSYHSNEEKESRFHIWSANHHRTMEKNRRHGPCKLTKQTVFGSNQFKDLSPEEFKGKYLTGYNGPRTDELESTPKQMPNDFRHLKTNKRPHMAKVLDPNVQRPTMHETVRQRMLQQGQYAERTATVQCEWYDVSCILRWLYNSSGMQFGIIGTMEPKFDADAYPNSVDWRSLGAVTNVRYQGACGGCWAITAVETIESAHYISTGKLYDLSEAEIITCETSCQMCDGGWPQNAFQWTMDHGGLPLSKNFAYDAYTLAKMTAGLEEESSYSGWTEETINSYREQVCPAGSYGDSNDAEYDYNGSQNQNYGDYSSQGRYGNIKGFGYATERCVCYSDGSGCDCDDQNENTAIGNLASYGPAVVCVDASLWQDYNGGIITSEVGCGSTFFDSNHCVQAVGYAFTDESNSDGEGSQDEKRNGYWIIRNQWGSSWGMNGYAYVAMGENTCGVLNDMTQAYL